MTPALMMWSGGKDSALALDRVRRSGLFNVVALVTTINVHYRRVSMHGVREDLVLAQAASIGLAIEKMPVSLHSSNEEYVNALQTVLRRHRQRGVDTVIYGDIFLEDLRRWRESLLKQTGNTAHFPLWKENTRDLYTEFLERGFKAVTCCVNDAWLDASHAGRMLDATFRCQLPADVDQCGENGEYHSFVFDGPIFSRPLPVKIGEKVYRPLELTKQPCPMQTSDGGDKDSSPPPCVTKPTKTRGFWFCDMTIDEPPA